MADRGRVLQLSTMVPPSRHGGAESVVGAFSDRLRDAGFTVHDAGLKARGTPGEATPIPNIYWPFDGRRRGAAARLAWHAVDALTPAGARAVARLIDAVDPAVVITHNLRGWGLAPWAVARDRQIPVIHVVHDYGLLCNTSTLWHRGGACGAPCRLRARRASALWPGGILVGVSEAVLAEHRLRGFGVGDPSAVIHPVGAAGTVEPRSRGVRAGAPEVFGYLGRVTTEKGIGHLVEAVRTTDAALIVAGEGAGDEVSVWQARSNARTQWWGWTEPAKLFEAIDALVVPSLWREPFGLVVVEAARAGVPVLVAGQPGLLEAVRSAGALHHSYAPDDATALRAALRVPIEDYRRPAPAAPSADIVEVVAGQLEAASP